jgi:iron complex outermembrane receptor protein
MRNPTAPPGGALCVDCRRPGWLVLAIVLAVPLSAGAQTVALDGRVTDTQGGLLPGVTVAAETPTLAAPAVVVTDIAGRYEFSELPPGTYIVVFSLDGFQTERREQVVLRAGRPGSVDAELGVARLTERVDVVGITPLLGAEIDRDLIPATVSVIGSNELRSRGTASLADALAERLGSVSIEGTTTNPFQPTLRFRGFTASPLLGLPQGIAVFQNGVRINEPFGDTVQFDLMPQFAVSQTQLSAGADPTYGLNALGGSLALNLKNGFDFTGFGGELSGGSFERYAATAEFGAHRGPWAYYVGATRFDEQGWRDHSPSGVTQAVADVGYRAGRIDAGVTLTYADTRMNGNGPAPVELLAADRTAVFTFPDTTENRLAFVQGRFDLAATDVWSVQVIGYVRDLDRQTLNGDEAALAVCDDDSLPPGAPANTLCLGAGDDDDDALGETGADPLVDAGNPGRFITSDDAAGDGAINRTSTLATGYGATLQASGRGRLGGLDHVLIMGVSADLANVDFSSTSEVGSLTDARGVTGSGLFSGIFGRAPDDIFSTALDSENRVFGLFFSETLSLNDRTHLTASGRFNHARVSIADRLGTSLDGRHRFSRFNPGIGLVFQAHDAVTLFGRYSESNRAPTAAELSCADPAEPCRVPNAFVSDPPLEQAVARSVEGGLRGRWTRGAANLDWSASVYRTRINDDILFVASPALIGTGFFQNAGDTLRVGLDVDVRGQIDRVGWYLGYGLVEATFESALALPGNPQVNDAATDEGFLVVSPGDRLAGIPRHSLKAGVGVGLTSAWNVALETISSSSRVFFGDEGNDQAPLDGFTMANLLSSYRVRDGVELFVRLDNLFDTDYETFGALAELELELDEVPNASDPRFLAPGAPRSGFAGVRVRF